MYLSRRPEESYPAGVVAKTISEVPQNSPGGNINQLRELSQTLERLKAQAEDVRRAAAQ
jgi:hypothetical protein